jgi:hypothetical protein
LRTIPPDAFAERAEASAQRPPAHWDGIVNLQQKWPSPLRRDATNGHRSGRATSSADGSNERRFDVSHHLKSKWVLAALPLLVGIVLAAPAADVRVGVGITVPLVVPPPVVAAPPPVVVAPAPYYAVPPGYYYASPYYAPPPAYFWYDRFGRRHWRH